MGSTPLGIALLGGLALFAGCRTQDQNPFGAFGPATIPPPSIDVPGGSGYYPAPANSAPAPAAPPTNSLPSISVPSGGTPTPEPRIPRPYSVGSLAPQPNSTAGANPTTSFATDPADRQPIRVVEAAPGTSRFATTPSAAGAPPNVLEAAPAAREPIRAFTTNPPRPSSDPVEISRVPSLNRTRGYTPTQPLTPAQPPPAASQPFGGPKSSSTIRLDSSVAPAAYQPAPYVPAFTEPRTADGAWRSR